MSVRVRSLAAALRLYAEDVEVRDAAVARASAAGSGALYHYSLRPLHESLPEPDPDDAVTRVAWWHTTRARVVEVEKSVADLPSELALEANVFTRRLSAVVPRPSLPDALRGAAAEIETGTPAEWALRHASGPTT